VTWEGIRTAEVRTPNFAETNAAAAGSTIVEQPGIEQDPVAFPNGVTRPHMPFITRHLGLIKVSSPVAWLSQLWL